MGAAALEVAHYRIAPEDIAAESSRLTQALADAQRTVAAGRHPAGRRPARAGRHAQRHSLLLGDPLLAEQTLALIAERHYNAEWALTTQGQILGQQFDAMEDSTCASAAPTCARSNACCVLAGTSAMLPDMGHVDGDEALIVVAHDISPADMLRLRGGFAAFVTDLGGPVPYRHRGPQHGRAGGGGPGQRARAGARWRHADHRRRFGRRGEIPRRASCRNTAAASPPTPTSAPS